MNNGGYKDLGHFWLGYIRMLGHLQFGHLLDMLQVFFGYGTMTIERAPHPLSIPIIFDENSRKFTVQFIRVANGMLNIFAL